MTSNVELYFVQGCMRCPLGATPRCKVHNWQKELKLLRSIAIACNLQEEIKWGVPTYTFQNKNIMIIAAFKEYAALSFFKGSLLSDHAKLLNKPGENSQAARLLRFTETKDITENEAIIKAYIYEALEIEKAELKVNFKKNPEPIPEELKEKFQFMPALKKAFEALSNSKQRGYILYFSAAKQAQTRIDRIEKCIPKIFEGKALNDR
jgi:uncharacterized protein YdeI (YjbR/CyaY-like superfamily)